MRSLDKIIPHKDVAPKPEKEHVIESKQPIIKAERVEEERFEEARKKYEIISGVRTKIDKRH